MTRQMNILDPGERAANLLQRGLVAKELGRDKIIPPIWHHVSKNDILKYSPTLADKVAILSQKNDVTVLAVKLIEIIRPDLLRAIRRKVALRSNLNDAGRVDPRKLNQSPIRHPTFPDSFIWRLRLVRAALCSVYPGSLADCIDSFSRDSHPTEELHIWECAAAVFQEITNEEHLPKAHHRALYMLIFYWIVGENYGKLQRESKKLPKGVAARALSAMRSYCKLGDDWAPGLFKQFEGVNISKTDIVEIESFDENSPHIAQQAIDALLDRDIT